MSVKPPKSEAGTLRVRHTTTRISHGCRTGRSIGHGAIIDASAAGKISTNTDTRPCVNKVDAHQHIRSSSKKDHVKTRRAQRQKYGHTKARRLCSVPCRWYSSYLREHGGWAPELPPLQRLLLPGVGLPRVAEPPVFEVDHGRADVVVAREGVVVPQRDLRVHTLKASKHTGRKKTRNSHKPRFISSPGGIHLFFFFINSSKTRSY